MDDREFLENYDPAQYDRPSVTIDLVLMSILNGSPAILLTRRAQQPFSGRWALPGGFLQMHESLDEAARRILQEDTQIADAYVEQLYTFGAPDRDLRMRVLTVAYFALLPAKHFEAALKDNPALTLAEIEVPWPGETGGPVAALDSDCTPLPLAFDHAEILGLAIKRLRGKLDYSPVAFALLPSLFTLRQLQDVHESILGVKLNKPAFRRKMLDRNWISGSGKRETGASFRPAELYYFNQDNERNDHGTDT
ncbi:NUDIX hydrolase [Sphingopyxis sp. BSNA05]|uniref:NUDIX hydrolase n=1 Tax=Sphingopyxis sp. BSNA05 TaxID=1236614 RepID=UPI0015675C1F|nr:NUDIX domain-containing protein [Sphingopyxis sp. BSNA05]NRD90735.1 NUDIX hydrolase [Sphingopyxis sp. BSNA05]